MDKPSQCACNVLAEQLLWFIKLRWVAAGYIVAVVLVADYIFSVLINPLPLYICAVILLLCNVFYLWAVNKENNGAARKNLLLGTMQAEADLIILTAVLHFSGGVTNPFIFFYIFHVIISTIILPRNLSFIVGLTAILLFGLLVLNELNGGTLLGYYPLKFSVIGGLWRNLVYALSAFIAFICTVLLTRYLTLRIITRMTAKEQEAARNNDVLQAVIGAMSEGLIFINRNCDITICNPAAKLWELTSNKADNNISLRNFTPVLVEHIKSLLNTDSESVCTEQVVKFETEGNERHYIEARSRQVVGIDGQKLGYVIVGQDLSEHKKLENELLGRSEDMAAINEMLKMSRIEMAQREKMVAIGQMAAGIAHEIGNPLASLSSVAQYLIRKFRTNKERKNLLAIEYQVSRISKILKRMLNLSRPPAAEYKWVDINELIDNTISLVKFDKRMRAIDVQNVSCRDLPMVWLNPQAFEQVLVNIFINSMDAMNAVHDGRKHVLEVIRELKNETIEIKIRDSGIGMSPEVCKLAFESFFTTKEIGKGTGLGLFVSYNLITEMDGTITLQSEPNKGTTVTIRIPIRPQQKLIGNTFENFVNNTEVAKKKII